MAPNEQARKHHGELFPGHVSTLAVTDLRGFSASESQLKT